MLTIIFICISKQIHIDHVESVHVLKKSSENHLDPKNSIEDSIVKIISYFKIVGRSKFGSFVFLAKLPFWVGANSHVFVGVKKDK